MLFENDNKRSRIRASFGACVGLSLKLALLCGLWVGGNMIVGGTLTGGELASFAMYTMSVSSGVGGTMKVYARIMEVRATCCFVHRRWVHRSAYLNSLLHPSRQQCRVASIAFTATQTKLQTMQSPSQKSSEARLSFEMWVSPIPKTHSTKCCTISVCICKCWHSDLVAHPGENIGIVGGSGSGKSTISSLLGGLYKVSSGEVLLDGVNVNDLAGDFVRSVISIVMLGLWLLSVGTSRACFILWNHSIEHHVRLWS